MKKITKWMFVMIMAISMLMACSTNEEVEPQDSTTNETGDVTIIISEEEADEVYSEDEIPIEEDAILMDVMKENYDIEEEEGFIHSIDGVVAEEDDQKAWIYSVNGEEALVGAEEYELSIDDEVVFDLQGWE